MISAQPTKKVMASCYYCARMFTIGEPRLQQWGDRNSTMRYVHSHCVNGGLTYQHEFFPKDEQYASALDALKHDLFKIEDDITMLLPITDPHDETTESAPHNDNNEQQDDLSNQEEVTTQENANQEHTLRRGIIY